MQPFCSQTLAAVLSRRAQGPQSGMQKSPDSNEDFFA
jgi:hypothetical protein